MNPGELSIARELFTQWQRARGGRNETAARPFSRRWEDLLTDAGIVSAMDRSAAEQDIRGLAEDGWVVLKSVQYRAQLLDRISLPLAQETRWKEAFGFIQPTDDEKHLIRSHPWQPELAFLHHTPVNLSYEDLGRLDGYLAQGGRDRPIIPIKERSLEIFGDEKRLDVLLDSTVIRDGRLTLKQLRCEVVAEPLAWRRGPASVAWDAPVLVVENCATWHSFVRWNKTSARYRAIVYGRGNAFIDSVGQVPELFLELGGSGPIEYFGDLDPAGLRIPRRAHRRAQDFGLPPVEPAGWCYQSLLTRLPGSEPEDEDLVVNEEDLAWLGDLAEKVRELFTANRRLAQEHIGWEHLRLTVSSVGVL